ncbi:FAD-dependent oxidoreductase [Niallia sp. Krafla_26]|uniref:FAD-dependent oxidoreductase n=1 Tax=Niallia sp. Krafla_26 TaxID=3064703 RepID=UPI003D16A4CC
MYDIVIIGGGPAGGSAALYAAKAGKKTLLLDANKSMTARALMWNHYGVEEITGPDMLEVGKKQASKFGAEIKEETVTNITGEAGNFTLETESGATYQGSHVILATGALATLAEKLELETKEHREPRMKTAVVTNGEGETNKKGIWAAGVVAGISAHTIVTAGDGARVAINVLSEINGERYVDHDVLK